MYQEKYLIDPGKKALRTFIEESQSTLDGVEERLSLKQMSDSAYLKELGERYRIKSVSYSERKIVEASIQPKKDKVKDEKKAYNTINQELDRFEIQVPLRISEIRDVLGKLVPFDEKERRFFKKICNDFA